MGGNLDRLLDDVGLRHQFLGAYLCLGDDLLHGIDGHHRPKGVVGLDEAVEMINYFDSLGYETTANLMAISNIEDVEIDTVLDAIRPTSAGTMVIVSFLFMLGPRGLFIEFRGGAVLVLVMMSSALASTCSSAWMRRAML